MCQVRKLLDYKSKFFFILNNIIDPEDEIKRNIAKTFIDDEAELSELDCSSDDEDNLPNFINESGDEEGNINS